MKKSDANTLLALAILVPLLVFAYYFWQDWKHGSFGVIVDAVAVVILVFGAGKIFIGAPSESEKQRRLSDQKNQP